MQLLCTTEHALTAPFCISELLLTVCDDLLSPDACLELTSMQTPGALPSVPPGRSPALDLGPVALVVHQLAQGTTIGQFCAPRGSYERPVGCHAYNTATCIRSKDHVWNCSTQLSLSARLAALIPTSYILCKRASIDGGS